MKKRSSYEIDSNSPLAELFLEIFAYIKKQIGQEAKIKYNQNTTTFYTKEGGFCYIKAYESYVHIGWTRGIHISDKYDLLFGDGKTIRGQRLTKLDKKNKEAIKYYIQETLVFLIEHYELQKMRCNAKNKIETLENEIFG